MRGGSQPNRWHCAAQHAAAGGHDWSLRRGFALHTWTNRHSQEAEDGSRKE